MSLLSELMDIRGVVAAGDFSYRGDQYTFIGKISDSDARIMARLSRANLQSIRVQGDVLQMTTTVCRPGVGDCGLQAGKGWLVRGSERSVCVVSNVFCVFETTKTSVNSVLQLMLERLADAPDILI